MPRPLFARSASATPPATSTPPIPPAATPAVKAVLIGTPETVGTARDILSLATGSPEPMGCILIDKRQPRAAGGLQVFGGIDDLDIAARTYKFTLAVVSIPIAMADTINRVRAALRQLKIEERFIPPVQDLLAQAPPFAIGLGAPSGQSAAAVSSGRIDIAELIDRRSHEIDRDAVARILRGKRVMITGAGGSIGAELARIAASFDPEQIQLVERAENPLFEIDRQIARRFPEIPRRAVLHDVVDASETLRMLVDLKPQVVFHAAAHKHVPLMEDHPAHAVSNNLFGTKSIADAAVAAGVERFVMVSTDKAVNPTSVMGATKRLAELYVQWLHETSGRMSGAGGTRFSMVRFGNVLGSACSVLTIWSAQLAEGGPITVTDPRMTRYFMTIPEAAALVIQAAAIEHGAGAPAAVHVLDMGRPIPILDLARRYVRAHGFEPRVIVDGQAEAAIGALPTIDILFTGTRPGEKLHEELSYAAEQLQPTPCPGIAAWSDNPGSTPNCAAMIADLFKVRGSHERAPVLEAIRRYIPELP